MTTAVLVSAPFGGIEVHFKLLARAFEAAPGIDRLESIWLGFEANAGAGRLPPFRWHWYTATAMDTRREIRQLRKSGFEPDVAIFNQSNPALMLAPGTGLPPIILQLDMTPRIMDSMAEHYHGHPTPQWRFQRAKDRIHRRTLSSVGHVVAVSDLVRRSLESDYGVPPERTTVIPLTIDTDFFARRPTDERRDDVIRLAFVGGEFTRKGGQLLLDVARHRDFAACEFHIVTTSDVHDAPPNVIVHRDVGPNSEKLRALLADSSIFVLPTLADLSSIASIEAMSMELPVVTTAVGGIPEIVEDGTTGFLIPPDDRGALHDRLAALVGSEDLRRSMGAAGRSRVLARHSLDVNVPRYLEIMEAVK